MGLPMGGSALMHHSCARSDNAVGAPQAWQRCRQPPALRACLERCMPTASRRCRTSLLPRSSGRAPRWVLVGHWVAPACHLIGNMLLSSDVHSRCAGLPQPLLLPSGQSSNVGLSVAWEEEIITLPGGHLTATCGSRRQMGNWAVVAAVAVACWLHPMGCHGHVAYIAALLL